MEIMKSMEGPVPLFEATGRETALYASVPELETTISKCNLTAISVEGHIVDNKAISVDDKLVCYQCIGERLISEEIRTTGRSGSCSYCKAPTVACFTIEQLALRIDERYRRLVSFADEGPEFGDEDRVTLVRNGESPDQLIGELLQVDDGVIADDLVEYLAGLHQFTVHQDAGTDWYDASSAAFQIHVEASPHYRMAWEQFCESIKHRYRFFGAGRDGILDEILGPILRGESKVFQAAIRTIGPGTKDRFIFRARPANDDVAKSVIYRSPLRELGAPPRHLATAGRMNPHGISVFYGSLDAKTCVAELRTPVHGQVVVGRFEIIRPLRILDLRMFHRIRSKLSYFDANFFEAYDYERFIRSFHAQIRKTVIPGRELLEYLPTQVVAEYLWSFPDNAIDGLIFGSAQLSGPHFNMVLFPSSCAAEGAAHEVPLDIESVVDYSAFAGGDGLDPPFGPTVFIRNASAKTQTPSRIETDSVSADEQDTLPDTFPSLRLHRESLMIVRARKIEYEINEMPVSFRDAIPEKDEPLEF